MKSLSARFVSRAPSWGKHWLAVVVLLICACNRPEAAPVEQTAPVVQEPPPVAPASVTLPDGVWRGACLAHNWQERGARGYGTEASAEVLDHLASIDVDWISVTPFGFMTDQKSNLVEGEHNRTPPDGAERAERLERVLEQARARGIKVMLKPHIWIRGGKWRGAIKPANEAGEPDWDGWWDSHDAWILYYAELAERNGIEALVIGLELHSAVRQSPERLVQLANKVRAIYRGHITYAANWNEPVPDDVWRAVDSIGVQFYPPLTKARGAVDPAELRGSLRTHLSHWEVVAERTNRPLVITEVGYRSADLAARLPNAWPENINGSTDEALQKEVYRLFFEELRRTKRLGGVFLWKYFTDRNTDEEGPTGFTPRGKPAEAVIREAFSD